MAVLKEERKVPSESKRLMMLVTGGRRASMHDFRRFVGMISREQVESEEERIASRTSRVVAGENSERSGGATKGGGLRF